MLIRLKNFRMYEEAVFEFSTGVTLVCGDTGTGKSTIFQAIYYALYNLRQPYPLPEAGSKKKLPVKVVIEYKDVVTITRKSNPSHLLLTMSDGGKYEGEEAQAVIDQLFGNKEMFSMSSYMAQEETSVLFSGTDSNILQAMRSVGFHNEDVRSLKDKIKTYVAERKVLTDDASKKKLVAVGILENFVKRHGDLLADNVEVKNNVEEEIQTWEKKVKDLERDLKDVQEKEAAVRALRSKVGKKSVGNVEDLEGQLQKLRADFDDISQRLQKAIEQDAAKKARKKLEDQAKNLEDMRAKKTKELQVFQTELSELEKTLFVESIDSDIERIQKNNRFLSKINAIHEKHGTEDLITLKALITKDKDALKTKSDELEDVRESLENMKNNRLAKEKADRIVKCPECFIDLKIMNGKLSKAGEEAELKLLDVKIPTASTLDLKRLEREHKDLDTKLLILTKDSQEITILNRNVSRVAKNDDEKLVKCLRYKEIQPRVERLKADLEAIPSIEVPETEKVSGESVQSIRQELIKCETSRRNVEKEIMLQNNLQRDSKDLEEALKILGDKSSEDVRKNMKKIKETLKELRKHEETQKLVQEQKVLKENISSASEIFVSMEKDLIAGTKIYETAKVVERSVLERTFHLMNQTMKPFIDDVFEEEMVAQFNSTRELKSGKGYSLKCGLQIFNKGYEYGAPKQLSGGERHRVSVAMMLAVSEIVGSEMILIDESLSSLDSNRRILIIEHIRARFPDKICVVISHHAIKGTFDNVIELHK